MSKPTDPHAAREASKYDNPIPSREFILDHLGKRRKAATLKQMIFDFGLFEHQEVEALRRRLRAMERDGQLVSDRQAAYSVVNDADLIAGCVIGHRDGFGFLKPDDGSEDLFLHHRQMRTVFDGDHAKVRISGVDQRGRPEATIVAVTQRNTRQVVGRLCKESGICFLRPDNQRLGHDIRISNDDVLRANAGQYVVAEIVTQPSKRQQPVGRLIDILGDHMAPGMEIDVAIRTHDIPNIWSEEASAQAAALPSRVSHADCVNRVDLRNMPFVTIDGEDARDFDDAVFCRKRRLGGWRLYVAIADVSHYVRAGTHLDQEAYQRATSVYFPGQVIPMLPEAISNGLCSLNPHVDRLVMVCEMTVASDGQVSSYRFGEGVIHSHARLTYTQVASMLDPLDADHGHNCSTFKTLLKPIKELNNLYHELRHQRDLRGAIDFETQETRIVFGEDRKIEQIVPVQRNDAHKLIEECMLAANVCAASFLQALKIPSLYRVHNGPKPAKLEQLRSNLMEYGFRLAGGNEPSPQDFQELLQRAEGHKSLDIIQSLLLRSLGQATYTPENDGHFGLGYAAYAHFTSPIRRYPDLLMHRAIRSIIQGKAKTKLVQRTQQTQTEPSTLWYPYDYEQMLTLGEHCSMAERRADEAVWDVEGWLKCEYMSGHIGEQFDATISTVTSFGMFVALTDVFVEGLVHVTALPRDYYRFDAAKSRLVGERTRHKFGVGNSVKVRLVRVDLNDRKIDFELV